MADPTITDPGEHVFFFEITHAVLVELEDPDERSAGASS